MLVISVIAAICAIGWFNAWLAKTALCMHLVVKNYTPPTDQEMEAYSQYLMAFEELDRAKETGYTKFTEMALNFSGLVRYIINFLPPDVIVYFLHHVEVTDSGKVKAKTVGKMIDSKLTLEGLFSIVLLCEATNEGHHFVTQSDGYTTAKSPMGMFDREIDNDLAIVDTTIREYWNLGGTQE